MTVSSKHHIARPTRATRVVGMAVFSPLLAFSILTSCYAAEHSASSQSGSHRNAGLQKFLLGKHSDGRVVRAIGPLAIELFEGDDFTPQNAVDYQENSTEEISQVYARIESSGQMLVSEVTSLSKYYNDAISNGKYRRLFYKINEIDCLSINRQSSVCKKHMVTIKFRIDTSSTYGPSCRVKYYTKDGYVYGVESTYSGEYRISEGVDGFQLNECVAKTIYVGLGYIGAMDNRFSKYFTAFFKKKRDGYNNYVYLFNTSKEFSYFLVNEDSYIPK